MNTIFTYIKLIPLSFYSRTLYRDAYNRWQGIGAVYLLTFILLLNILITLALSSTITKALTPPNDDEGSLPVEIEHIIAQMPVITIKNGKAHTEAPHQYIIHSIDDTPIITIDTLDTEPKIETAITISQDSLTINDGHSQHKIFSIAQLLTSFELDPSQSYTLDNKTLITLAYKLVAMRGDLAPALYLVCALTMIFSQIPHLLFFAFIAIFMSQLMRVKLTFAKALRLSAISSTPYLTVYALSQATLQPLFTYPDATYLAIHCVYLHFAVKSCKNQPDPTPTA